MAEYKVVSWSPGEVVTAESLNALAGRDDWLREFKAQGKHTSRGVSRNTGILLVSGIVGVGKTNSSSRSVAVKFGNFFSTGVQPAVTTSITSSSQGQLFVTVTGPGKTVLPTRDGFDVKVTMSSAYPAAKRKLNACYVSYIAMGY